MSTFLMKLHTETERCKEEWNRKEIVCPHVPGHHAAQLSLSLSQHGGRLILPKQATMKGKAMSLPKLFHTTSFFSLFCFLLQSWIRKHFIGVFRSMPCLMDISDPYRPKTTAGRHSWYLTSKMQTIIQYRVHIWILNPTRSKSLRIANRSEDTQRGVEFQDV